jgi:hypothetical protein
MLAPSLHHHTKTHNGGFCCCCCCCLFMFVYSLLSSGYSMVDIVAATLEVLEIKQLREESVRNKKWDGVNAALENTTRTLKRVARRGSILTITAPVVRMGRRGSMPADIAPPLGDYSSSSVSVESSPPAPTTGTKSRRNSIFGSVPLITADPHIDSSRAA